jgi:hypothetical protein
MKVLSLATLLFVTITTTRISYCKARFREHMKQIIKELLGRIDDCNDREECPKAPYGTVCAAQYDPYLCDGDCEYSNRCWVEAAGFKVALECIPTSPCPEVPYDADCSEDYDPYMCPGNCEYNNNCEAYAAAFDVEEECFPN